MKRIDVLLIAHILLSTALLKAGDLPDAKTVLFLGDSITHSGQYIAFLETVLLAETDRRFQFLNLGLSSETVSGLSEDGHAGGKFPRPDLHERLDRVLAKTKPDLILACYGMNCGIYQPLDDGRFQKFKDGIQWLHEKAKAAAADIIHLTPPTYDTQQRKGEAPYYNSVLATYGQWLLAQRTNGWQVIDIHGPMDALLSEMRGRDAAAFLAKDGVHPGAEGHWLMAQQILRYWKVPSNQTAESFIARIGTLHDLYELVSKRQRLLGASYLAEAGHKRPGVTPGLPLAEALRQAHELDTQIDAAAAAARKAVVPSPFSGTRSTWNGYDKYDFVSDGKPALVGLSRGGLHCYNWAIANPEKVSCIYADAPVCDFKSWPGGKGKGKGDPKNWALVMSLWAFKDEAEALAARVNPIDNLAPLAKAGVSSKRFVTITETR